MYIIHRQTKRSKQTNANTAREKKQNYLREEASNKSQTTRHTPHQSRRTSEERQSIKQNSKTLPQEQAKDHGIVK